MIFVRKTENAGNEIVEQIRKYAEFGHVVITKDDCISFMARIAPRKRLNFSIQMNGIIITGKEICLGNYYKNIKTDNGIYADEINYTHLELGGTSVYFEKNHSVELSDDNTLSFEICG